MVARIYQPTKNAMQSGRANTRHWVLEFEPEERRELDPLMGWTGSGDTRSQIRIRFPSEEAAVAFAKRNNLAYTVIRPHVRRPKIKSYAENFR
ncbi:MAG: ETC complex I subunit [Alphaproteobacteria bacterium]|nr:MAG: ETC complex I subunit [Alphaproteobacteria bacterium]